MKNLSKVAMGLYRMTVRSSEHKEALITALENGCNLLDTSSNYTDGESEKLIGEVLAKNPQFSPTIISKAGYIQGVNIEVIRALNAEGKANDDLVIINENLMHSIHPEFLEDQLKRSLERLGKKKIDIFLLHNPEYYLKQENSKKDEYYRRIKLAFEFLETQVEAGVIGCYGVSSNTFVETLFSDHNTNLEKLIEAAKSIKADNGFKYIQFPLNLIETGALIKQYNNKNLIEFAKANGIKTLANRPLNAFTDQGLLRLATYDQHFPQIPIKEAHDQMEKCLKILEDKLKERDDDLGIREIPLMKQIQSIWTTLPTPDACEQVFFQNFYPLVAKIWGGKGLKKEESVPFFSLFEIATLLSREKMSERALTFRDTAEKKGLIPIDNEKELPILAIETYLEWGVDHVLVGMKRESYVKDMTQFF
jgi:aryl-alcohol dehydrogenase-like predicted oxidoreductase